MKSLPQVERKRLLALIHLAATQLGLEDAAYRDLLERVTGERSAARLGVDGLHHVLEEMKRLGFRVAAKKLSPPTQQKPPEEKTAIDKIRALWIEGAKRGLIRNRYEPALNRFVKRLTKVERVEWLTAKQAQTVIAALNKMIEEKPDGNGK